MNFIAELKETKQAKTASLDNIYEVKFRTNNPMILDLGKLPADTLFDINVTLYSTPESKSSEENAGYEQI